MRPHLFSAQVDLARKVHVYSPIVWVPRDLPVEVKARQDFETNVEPEAGRPDASSAGIPTAFFDQRPSSCYVVHPLKSTFTHNFVHIKNYSGSGANDGIAVGVLESFEKMAGGGIVVVQCFLFGVYRIDQGQVSCAASEEGV